MNLFKLIFHRQDDLHPSGLSADDVMKGDDELWDVYAVHCTVIGSTLSTQPDSLKCFLNHEF